MNSPFDVVIVGAGPAGSVLAIRLSQLGLRCALIERASFPRNRIGESLSRGIWQQMHFIGAAEALAALQFPSCETIDTRWGATNSIRQIDQPGLLADRAAFDQLLLNLAIAHGAFVLMPAKLIKRERGLDGWRLSVQELDQTIQLKASFLVDASGSARILGGSFLQTAPKTLALHAYWQCNRTVPAIISFSDGWCWSVPIINQLSKKCLNHIFIFTDSKQHNKSPEPIDERYESIIRLLGLLQSKDQRISPVQAADATPSICSELISENHLCVGEAALRIDPLSASGVQLSIQSALQAAIVLHTMIRRTENCELAMQFHRDALHQACMRHQAFSVALYADALSSYAESNFWQARAQAHSEVQNWQAPACASDARIVGDFIARA